MYVGFELNNYRPLSNVAGYELDSFREQKDARHEDLSSYLIGVFENKEVVDAEKISQHIFPFQKADIFLSHSHADEEKAIELAVSLQKKGLNVFVDSCVWGYFHKLLDGLNEVYAEPNRHDKGVTYNYRKATDLTAGVHMMLSGALHQMIQRCELFIFLNTDKSIPLENYQSFDRTFSPWIYSELQFSSQVKRTTPDRHLQPVFESYDGSQGLIKSTASSRSDVLLAFKAFNRHLPKITGEEMQRWYNQDVYASHNHSKAEVALDALYESHDIVSRYADLENKMDGADARHR